jgi:4-carboxymuconolactone decarboxylase
MDHNDERYETGLSMRRAVLGDHHVDRALASRDELTADFQDFITRYAWGEIWSRDGLDRRTRSVVTLAILATLHHEEELGMHVRAARRIGVTTAEIAEVLLHTAVYAGVPAANRALAVAQRVLADTEPDNPADQESGSGR